MLQSLANDFAFLRAAAGDLQDYLVSEQLYWRLPGDLLQLTPGSLLLCQRRLAGFGWTGAQRQELEQLLEECAAATRQWRAHFLGKARQEAQTRLEQWSAYLQDIPTRPGKGQEGYPFQVRSRAILALLAEQLAGPADLAEALARLDARLEGLSQKAGFVWEAEIRANFPEEEFWFLYVRLGR